MAFTHVETRHITRSSAGTSIVAFDGSNDTALTFNAHECVIVTLVIDNVGTTSGADTNDVTGITGCDATWTKAKEHRVSNGAAGDGLTVSCWYAYRTTSTTGSLTITFNGSVTNSHIVASRFAAGTTPTQVSVHPTKASEHKIGADAGALSISSLPSKDWIFFRGVGTERADFGYGATTGWTGLGSNHIGGIQVAGEYLLTTATTASGTSDPGTDAFDNASAMFAITEGALDPPRTGTASITLASAATSQKSGKVEIRANKALLLNSSTTSADGKIALSADEQAYLDWLENDQAARCILVEANVKVGASEITRYMSNRGYVTGAADTPANTIYEPIIVGGINLQESLGLDSAGSMQYGDFEIDNSNGDYNSWLNDTWTNRSVRVYIGDVSWARSKFRKVMDGIVFNIDSRNPSRLNIILRDKLQRLNSPITEDKLGTRLGVMSIQSETLLPLTFGECHNVEPLLVSPPTLEYQFHNGSAERLIEVRDNGVPVKHSSLSLEKGTFGLARNPAGQITCSVQGENNPSYSNTVADIIKIIATQYGKATDRFTDDEIDQTNLDFYKATNNQPIGLYIRERVNVLEAIGTVAQSIGAQVVISREGKLQLLRLSLPPQSYYFPALDIEERDIKLGTFSIVGRTEVRAGVKLGYCRNWIVQDNLQTAIPAEHKQLFKEEWLTVTQFDTTVANNYRLHKEPEREDTLLIRKSDADAEATRRLNLRKVQRTIYRFEGFAKCLQARLGQACTIKTERFGLSAGVTGMVISLSPDWISGTCTVEVIV